MTYVGLRWTGTDKYLGHFVLSYCLDTKLIALPGSPKWTLLAQIIYSWYMEESFFRSQYRPPCTLSRYCTLHRKSRMKMLCYWSAGYRIASDRVSEWLRHTFIMQRASNSSRQQCHAHDGANHFARKNTVRSSELRFSCGFWALDENARCRGGKFAGDYLHIFFRTKSFSKLAVLSLVR